MALSSCCTPRIQAPQTAITSSRFQKLLLPESRRIIPTAVSVKSRTNVVRICKPVKAAALSDPYVLELAETLEDSLSSSSSLPPILQKLRDSSAETLLSTPWPSRKDEPFRNTDTSFIKTSKIQPILAPSDESLGCLSTTQETLLPTLSIVDGYLVNSLSLLSELPSQVYVGSLSNLNSDDILKRVSEFVSLYESSFRGDLFWSINGVGAAELILIYVPEGCRVEKPLHIRYLSAEGAEKESKSLPISNPRVLVLVEKGGEVDIVEEYVSGNGDKCYWTNSVTEFMVGEDAKVNHSYIQTQSSMAAHIKWTSVHQVNILILKHAAALFIDPVSW